MQISTSSCRWTSTATKKCHIWITFSIWGSYSNRGFPKIGASPNHPSLYVLIVFSIINHPVLGTFILGNTPLKSEVGARDYLNPPAEPEPESAGPRSAGIDGTILEVAKAMIFWLVVWLPFFIFPYIGNFIIPIDFHIFQRGSNHQPVLLWMIITNYSMMFMNNFPLARDKYTDLLLGDWMGQTHCSGTHS